MRRFTKKAAVEIEKQLKAFKVPYTHISRDEYDNSIELYGAAPAFRLTDDVQKYLFDCGFSALFVNHTDGWETHYNWLTKGTVFRVSYPHKRGEENGAILVEKPVESWPKQWFETGYAKVVKL